MNFAPAIRHLKRADAVLRRLIQEAGPCRLHLEFTSNQFAALVDSIIYQQLALKAAQTISRRFQLIYARDGASRGRFPAPAELQGTPWQRLRGAGLSRQKIGYMRDLARRAADGTLAFGRFGKMSDDEVIANVTQVKGIGRWTGEMFLIFSLRRPDVLPVDDLGLQYAIKNAYGLRKLPSEKRIRQLAEPWRPYRSVATWYVWNSRRKEIGAVHPPK